jgi:hypothetical protein
MLVATLMVELMACSTKGRASSHCDWHFAVKVRKIWPVVLFDCSLLPSAWGWNAEESWRLVEVRFISSFQNFEVHVLLQSPMINVLT